MGSLRDWLRLATSRRVVMRACKMAVVVGILLIAINHSDALLDGNVSPGRAFRMALTVVVPFVVSTVSSVGALRERNGSMPGPREGV